MTKSPTPPTFPELKIHDLEPLHAAEKEILNRIQRIPNGPRLLLIDPLQTLRTTGLHLGDKLVQEIRRRRPNSYAGIPEATFRAWMQPERTDGIEVKLTGLFGGRP